MPPLRVVFDTNIYIMAAGMSSGFIDTWLELANPQNNKFKLFTSRAILAEVQEKLEQKLSFDRALAVEYIDHLKYITQVIEPTQRLDVIKADPDDNIVLECAVEAKADIIVSADKDLIKLKRYENIQITHPTNLKYIFSYLNEEKLP